MILNLSLVHAVNVSRRPYRATQVGAVWLACTFTNCVGCTSLVCNRRSAWEGRVELSNMTPLREIHHYLASVQFVEVPCCALPFLPHSLPLCHTLVCLCVYICCFVCHPFRDACNATCRSRVAVECRADCTASERQIYSHQSCTVKSGPCYPWCSRRTSCTNFPFSTS